MLQNTCITLMNNENYENNFSGSDLLNALLICIANLCIHVSVTIS